MTGLLSHNELKLQQKRIVTSISLFIRIHFDGVDLNETNCIVLFLLLMFGIFHAKCLCITEAARQQHSDTEQHSAIWGHTRVQQRLPSKTIFIQDCV